MSTIRALYVVFFLAGLSVGLIITNVVFKPAASIVGNLVEHRERGKYTSPLLECDAFEPLPPQQLAGLKRAINRIKDNYEGKAVMSIYVRGLSNGGAVSFDQPDEVYDAASLMKLPVYIALMKQIELKPEIEQLKLKAFEGNMNEQNIVEGQLTKPGEELTIHELIQRSIINSDNRAIKTLLDYVGIYAFNEVLRDHGLPEADMDQQLYKVTPQEYSAFFRVLYNATYLKPESSEKILELLTQTGFEKGIRSGVPNSIPIAHKFGEQLVNSSIGSTYELHDCGIVYANRPYMICIMTKGDSFETLYQIMHLVSSKTYEVMTAEY